MKADQELKSLKRGLRLLVLLADHRSLTVSEAARRLDLPRTTAERILATLETETFIARLPESKRYALTSRVLALSEGFSAEDRLVEAARPLLFETTAEIGWPVALATPLGERMSVRVTTDPSTSLGLHKRHVGSEIAMAEASSGIVHLAFLRPAEREAQIALLASAVSPVQPLARDPGRLGPLIAAARRDGYSLDPARGVEWALSVPVFEAGRIRAVLVMMYMARVISRDAIAERFVPRMKALAAALERVAFGATP